MRRRTLQVALGFVWLVLLVLPAVAVATSGTATVDPLWTALRLAALEGLTLIFVNIVIGSYRPLLHRAVKPRVVHRLHVATGSTGFALVVAHGIMLVVFGVAGYSGGPFWLGPVMLVVLAAAILSALGRRRLRRSWRWIHRLNYAVFAAALVHSFALGRDVGDTSWLQIVLVVYAAVVAAGLLYRYTGLSRGGKQRSRSSARTDDAQRNDGP